MGDLKGCYVNFSPEEWVKFQENYEDWKKGRASHKSYGEYIKQVIFGKEAPPVDVSKYLGEIEKLKAQIRSLQAVNVDLLNKIKASEAIVKDKRADKILKDVVALLDSQTKIMDLKTGKYKIYRTPRKLEDLHQKLPMYSPEDLNRVLVENPDKFEYCVGKGWRPRM